MNRGQFDIPLVSTKAINQFSIDKHLFSPRNNTEVVLLIDLKNQNLDYDIVTNVKEMSDKNS